MKKAALNVRFENNPPRPASGEGDVVFGIGEQELTLRWKGGELAELVAPAAMAASFAGDMQMEEADGAIQCYKCWVDTETGAWICLPTAC